MTENRFFTFLWRFNAIAIALAVSVLLAILVWELTRDWRRTFFVTQTSEVLNIAPDAQTTDGATPVQVVQNARFGAPGDPAVKGIYAVPQYVEQTYANRGISKESGGNRVNFLIVNTSTQTQRWLFDETTNRLITEVRALWHTPATDARQLMGHVLHVIEADTNADERLSRSDLGALYFVPPDWNAPLMLTDRMDRLLTVQVTDRGSFDVINSGPTQTILRRITLPDATTELEMVLR